MAEPFDSPDSWRRCSSCKKPIAFRAKYWVCNVSTCTRKRTGLIFCTVSCWDAHVPQMNHRESWAEERVAPTREEWQKTLSGEDKPVRKRRTKEELQAIAAAEAEAARPATSGAPKVMLRRPRSE
ncbi:hypothetical protein WDW37_13570 [Bdellovibrionota bacterium FG-1]